MRVAFLGLSACGKTTLFNALTGAHASVGTYSGAGTSVHIGQVRVEDGRLDFLKRTLKPAKVTPAIVEVVDTPALAMGAHENKEGNARLMATLRESQALALVVRAFVSDRVAHPRASVDPMRDIRDLKTELAVADLDVVEKRIRRIQVDFQRGHVAANDPKEQAVLERVKKELDAGRGASAARLNVDEQKMLASYSLLTLKPTLVVFNVDEGHLLGASARPWSGVNLEMPALEVDAEWEMEIHELPKEEWKDYLADMHIEEPCDGHFVRAVYAMMDFVTFFTCNENELRAWPLKRYSTAVDAAASVHTDMARGFIRAEVIAVDDLKKFATIKDVRTRGKERLEGKTGPILDGDLVHFRFSV